VKANAKGNKCERDLVQRDRIDFVTGISQQSSDRSKTEVSRREQVDGQWIVFGIGVVSGSGTGLVREIQHKNNLDRKENGSR